MCAHKQLIPEEYIGSRNFRILFQSLERFALTSSMAQQKLRRLDPP